MIAWQGNLSFKVYNPDKPDKFGVKVYEICDSGNGYCYQFEIYTGKQHQVSKHGATYDIVMRLMAPLLNQGYRLYIDNYYTSPVLLQDLYYKKTVACGTLRSNWKGVPTVIKTTKLAKGDHMAMTLTGGNLQLIKWRDKRDVLILTSMHNAEFCDVPHGNRNGEAVRKPKAVLDYNKYMGAVDRSDQMLQYQAFKRKTEVVEKGIFSPLQLGCSKCIYHIPNESGKCRSPTCFPEKTGCAACRYSQRCSSQSSPGFLYVRRRWLRQTSGTAFPVKSASHWYKEIPHSAMCSLQLCHR